MCKPDMRCECLDVSEHSQRHSRRRDFKDYKSVNESSQTLESSPNPHSNNQGSLEENVVETVVGDISGTVARKCTTDEKESCYDTLRLTTDIVQKQPVPVPAKKHKKLNENKPVLGRLDVYE